MKEGREEGKRKNTAEGLQGWMGEAGLHTLSTYSREGAPHGACRERGEEEARRSRKEEREKGGKGRQKSGEEGKRGKRA